VTPHTNPVEPMVAHVMGTSFADLPTAAVDAAKIFVLDTFSCALAGSTGPSSDEALAAAKLWGTGDGARVWARSERLPPTSAAVVNAYQIHCLEFDCVHEGGVLHPMSTLMAATMAEVDRLAGLGQTVSGQDLIRAIAMGIDVSCSIAASSNAPMRFFRPALTGGFGATTSVSLLRGFDGPQLHNALGLYYGQAGGNMQAHVEGSRLLGLQVGFGARNALVACDLADAGIEGPKDILTGMYGYLVLMEGDYDLEPAWSEWGKIFRLCEVGHKPFPSGRLTHYAVDALQQMVKAHGFSAADVAGVKCEVPPLPMRLVGRPDIPDPQPNYAKLCLGYVCATTLLNGTITQHDFAPDALGRADVHDLARRVEVVEDSNPDLNAFGPQTITVTLKDGTVHDLTVTHAIGDPLNPLPRDRQLEKFWSCWAAAKTDMPRARGEALIDLIDRLDTLGDTAVLLDHICP
jgi:aconitate decarboxylase